MESGIRKKRLNIGGMTCESCRNKIESRLRGMEGVKSVRVSYGAATADISYDADLISLQKISAAIEKLDYQVLEDGRKRGTDTRRVLGISALVVSLYVLLQQSGVLNLLVPSRLADTKMGYGMLFVIGLVTSVHCIAMCGGINLSQCIPRGDTPGEKKTRFSAFRPSFLYNLGRVISYTAVGGILGFAGMLFGGQGPAGGSGAGLPAAAQGILKLIAGAFMVIMGVNMLGLFPWLRRLQPRMPKIFARRLGEEKARSKSPLLVGLLNGLMPCGPLQSMQIVALASGNPLAGALSMFLFSAGTVPLMLGLGSIVSALGRRFTQRVMSAGAVLVVVLGLAMLSQGGSLSGLLPPGALLAAVIGLALTGVVSSIPFKKSAVKTVLALTVLGAAVTAAAAWNIWVAGVASPGGSGVQIVDGKQIVSSTLAPGGYPNITVTAGIPVKWTINAPDGSINGCNNRINIQEYGIFNYSFRQGGNVIEFTPARTGRFQYSCWMGMISGFITVTEEGAASADGGDYADGGTEVPGPVPAGVAIPTGSVSVAKITVDEEYGGDIQEAAVELTDSGFSPAVVVVQAGLDVKWRVTNSVSGGGNAAQLLVPYFAAQLSLEKGENPLFFFPEDDFAFSTGDNTFYGYVKVVDDLEKADIAAIKEEIGRFETLIYPPQTFQQAGGGASCH